MPLQLGAAGLYSFLEKKEREFEQMYADRQNAKFEMVKEMRLQKEQAYREANDMYTHWSDLYSKAEDMGDMALANHIAQTAIQYKTPELLGSRYQKQWDTLWANRPLGKAHNAMRLWDEANPTPKPLPPDATMSQLVYHDLAVVEPYRAKRQNIMNSLHGMPQNAEPAKTRVYADDKGNNYVATLSEEGVPQMMNIEHGELLKLAENHGVTVEQILHNGGRKRTHSIHVSDESKGNYTIDYFTDVWGNVKKDFSRDLMNGQPQGINKSALSEVKAAPAIPDRMISLMAMVGSNGKAVPATVAVQNKDWGAFKIKRDEMLESSAYKQQTDKASFVKGWIENYFNQLDVDHSYVVTALDNFEGPKDEEGKSTLMPLATDKGRFVGIPNPFADDNIIYGKGFNIKAIPGKPEKIIKPDGKTTTVYIHRATRRVYNSEGQFVGSTRQFFGE